MCFMPTGSTDYKYNNIQYENEYNYFIYFILFLIAWRVVLSI